jgi:hypothetical protein
MIHAELPWAFLEAFTLQFTKPLLLCLRRQDGAEFGMLFGQMLAYRLQFARLPKVHTGGNHRVIA